ncbi:F-box protein SKIP14 [Diospyros lotus]|uniref:F-box protein SKIP14 n=1 Tax=Diospyros lotus TaxID=55363 RepID=UPI002256C70E|nr:F-box protein SKIP14 [Diospyros lotus]
MPSNLSHNSVFSTLPLEEGLFSAIKLGNGYLVEEYPDKNSNSSGNYMNLNWQFDNSKDGLSDETEKAPDDIIALLPSDPFGMDLSATFTAIKGWFEDFESDFGFNSLGFGADRVEVETGEDGLFTGINLLWNGDFNFHEEVDYSENQEESFGLDEEMWAGFYDDGLLLDGKVEVEIEELLGNTYEKYSLSSNSANELQGSSENHLSSSDGGAPNDALFFALGYLGMRDLLSVEMVCKSLRDAVQNDPLLWRSIHISQPLSDKITDDSLFQLASRAQGTLQCLSLVKCPQITDAGLTRVLDSNPGLRKLSVPGCLRLSVGGILGNLKSLKLSGKFGVKQLRISGLYGITDKQFEELKLLLGADNHRQLSGHKPRFYHGGQAYLTCDDDRAIDVEACPRCQKLRQVYDCPAESCQGKRQSPQLCRACIFCIARCVHCGRCIDGCDYEETFCLDLLCLDCVKQLLNSQKREEEVGIRSSKCTICQQQARCHFCLNG